MPETTIYKDREPELRKNKIRLAKDFLMPPPAGDFVPPKQFCQCNFRLLVPVPTNQAHYFRTLDF